jgi:hypothetical protein
MLALLVVMLDVTADGAPKAGVCAPKVGMDNPVVDPKAFLALESIAVAPPCANGDVLFADPNPDCPNAELAPPAPKPVG